MSIFILLFDLKLNDPDDDDFVSACYWGLQLWTKGYANCLSSLLANQ